MAVITVTLTLPGRDQERFGFGWVHRDVNDACLIIDEEDFLPRLAAIRGLEKTAVRVGAVQPAQGADVDDVRVLGMDDDSADLERLLQTHVLPRSAAIG